jgi:hypothetical protein
MSGNLDDDINFGGISAYTDYLGTYLQTQSLLTNNILAYNPTEAGVNNDQTVLTLGTTGEINFIVRGIDNMGKMSVDSNTDILNFTSLQEMVVSGNDPYQTTTVSKTKFQYNIVDSVSTLTAVGNDTVNNFKFDADMSVYTGSLQVLGDELVNGSMIAKSLNIVSLNMDHNVKIGFGFRITERDALELYKYDSSNGHTQRIATFGEGEVRRTDAHSNFPIFGTSNFEANEELHLGFPSNGGGGGLWDANGADIYYESGKVIIGASNTTSSQNYGLEVIGNDGMYVSDYIQIGAGTRILTESIQDVQFVQFMNAGDPILFKGTTDTLKWDSIPAYGPNNKTWLRNNQKHIDLGEFNNDMKMSDFYNKGSGLWFDKPQELVTLSSFNNDLVHFDSTITASNVEVQGINFLKIPSSKLFTGYIHELSGIADFPLSSFMNDIHSLSNFHVDTMSMCNIVNTLLPEINETINIGDSNLRFSKGYFRSINLGEGDTSGEILYDVSSNVLTTSIPLKLETITFANGGTLTSTGKGGDQFDDFDYVNMDATDTDVYKLYGNFTFNSNHEKVGKEIHKMYVYHVNNSIPVQGLPELQGANMIGTNEDGSIDYSSLTLIREQNTKFVDIDLLHEDGTHRNGTFYIAPFQPQSLNEIYNTKQLIPNSLEFLQKCVSDFQNTYNDVMLDNVLGRTYSKTLPWGFLTGELILSEFLKPINTGSYISNKIMLQYISYFETISLSDTDEHPHPERFAYLAPGDASSRRDGNTHIQNRTDLDVGNYEDDYQTEQVDDFHLYPKISIKNWKNCVNDSKFSLVPYHSAVNWFDESGVIIVENIPWIDKLLRYTYAYIKNGPTNYTLNVNDNAKIDQIMSQHTSGAHTFIPDDFVVINSSFGKLTPTGPPVAPNGPPTMVQPTTRTGIRFNSSFFNVSDTTVTFNI